MEVEMPRFFDLVQEQVFLAPRSKPYVCVHWLARDLRVDTDRRLKAELLTIIDSRHTMLVNGKTPMVFNTPPFLALH